MRTYLEEAIRHSDSDYADAMYEDTRQMTITFNKTDIQNVSNTVLKGGRVTVLDQGGYSGMSFTRAEDIRNALETAVRGARTVSKFDCTNRLLPAPVIVDEVKPGTGIDPAGISFDEKVALAREYIGIVLEVPNIFTSYGGYTETFTRKTYVNSEGTRIVQDVSLCFFSCRMIAREGNRTESMGVSVGFDSDYARLLNRHDHIRQRAMLCSDLLKARPVSPGVYTIVADQDLSGVFIHEAFGHLSEADDTINNKSLQKMLFMGRRMGCDRLNIVDQGNLSGASGYYVYDDEGVRASRTYLVKDGILTGRLHSRLSAAQLDGQLTGNYRAADYRFMPVVRMSNIYIENGGTPFEEMVDSIRSGLYLCGGKGGQTMGDLFTFGAQYGFEIENGKLGRMVKDINISGNVFDTLKSILKVGTDLRMNEGGGCGKTRAALFDMQMLDKSGTGGPSIQIKDVVIGGE
ncbi:TldD/PmbA family protein [bacterium]|nr:TldD/PmbA family protein [candidate division CSSED10-310 bacterium]